MLKSRFNLPKKTTPEYAALKALMQRAGDLANGAAATAAMRDVAIGLTLPLQQGVLDGPIFDIFEPVEFEYGTTVQFPYDLLTPSNEDDFIAWVVPRFGDHPAMALEGDFVTVPTYEIGANVDCSARFLKEANWNVLGRMLEILESMFVAKFNQDAWRCAIMAGVSRNLLVADTAATAGLFTRRLVTQMELYQRRNGGGNSASTIRGRLTDLFVSPEAQADSLSWGITEVPDAIRQQIYNDGAVTKIGKVLLHDLDELGVGQEFETYWDDDLAQAHTNDKVELVIGMDLQPGRQALVMPYRQMPQLYEDIFASQVRRVGMKGEAEVGWSCLDNRVVLLGQY